MIIANPHIDNPTQMDRLYGLYNQPTSFDQSLADKRNRMLELYNDPNWVLQTGLGDVEFEQGLYDHMAYGDSGPNELGLDSLRHFNEFGGPKRYYDPSPGESPYGDSFRGMFGMFGRGDPSDYADMSTLGFHDPQNYIIDMNLDNIIATRDMGLPALEGVPHEMNWEDTPFSTQNAINDLYTHELIHTNPRMEQFRNIEMEHPVIYRNTAKYGANPVLMGHGQRYFDESPGPTYGPPHPSNEFSSFPKGYSGEWLTRSKSDIADDIVRESTMYHGRSPIDERRRYKPGNYQTLDYKPKPVKRDRPKGTERFSTGGIVSLML